MKKQLLILAGLSTLLLGACGNNDTSMDNITEDETPVETTDTSTEETTNSTEPARNIPLGTTATLNDSDGSALATITLTKASRKLEDFPDYMIDGMDGEYDVNNMIALTFEYKNYNVQDGLSLNIGNFEVFDKDGRQVKIPTQQDGGDTVGINRTGIINFWANLPKDEDKVEIDFIDGGKPIATYEADVSK